MSEIMLGGLQFLRLALPVVDQLPPYFLAPSDESSTMTSMFSSNSRS
nr:hypothetical protein [Verrucomicrobium spinosum]